MSIMTVFFHLAVYFIFHLHPVCTSKHFDIFQNYEIAAPRRDELKEFLASKGVGTLIQWGGWMLHQFDDLNLRSHAPYAEKLS